MQKYFVKKWWYLTIAANQMEAAVGVLNEIGYKLGVVSWPEIERAINLAITDRKEDMLWQRLRLLPIDWNDIEDEDKAALISIMGQQKAKLKNVNGGNGGGTTAPASQGVDWSNMSMWGGIADQVFTAVGGILGQNGGSPTTTGGTVTEVPKEDEDNDTPWAMYIGFAVIGLAFLGIVLAFVLDKSGKKS